jgi:ubiquitin fusion degradation protein UFD1/E3A ubiquitin ligase-like protein
VVLSPALRAALGLATADGLANSNPPAFNGVLEAENQAHYVSVIARQLPKGTFVKLRPLEAGYDSDDWKALLEEYLRNNYTTLTKGDVLTIPGIAGGSSSQEDFRFLIDEFRPDSDGICIVDTDLEVDIEALNEEQARETIKRLATKLKPRNGDGTSAGGPIDLFQPIHGRVADGEFVDYELSSWDHSQGLNIELSSVDEDEEVALFVSPFGPRQRAKPRNYEYIFAQYEGPYPRKIQIQPTNTELEDVESIRISVHPYLPPDASPKSTPINFTISVNPLDPTLKPETPNSLPESHPPGDVQCKNCLQWVPSSRLVLHENFCLRNNILCPKGCGLVFQKQSSAWSSHWHCPHDSSYGTGHLSQSHHNHQEHTPGTCPGCSRSFSSLVALSAHRTTVCPAKLILCRFCHLQVPQGGDPDAPDPVAILSGLTPHELADGARTTDCHLCGKIVRLRDMHAHLAHHELSKSSRPPPRICANVMCGFTRDGTNNRGETRVHSSATLREGGEGLNLCPKCFGPLYVAVHDPDGKALRRRVERRYLTQLVTGCGKSWCANKTCRTGRNNIGLPEQGKSIREAMPLVKPVVDALVSQAENRSEEAVELSFCVDEGCQRARNVAEMLAAEGVFGLAWCVGAVEATAGDLRSAREWLGNWAPKKV